MVFKQGHIVHDIL